MPRRTRVKGSPPSSKSARRDSPVANDCVERRCLAGQGTICCPLPGLDACGVVTHANLVPLTEEEDRELARGFVHEESGTLDRKAGGGGRRGVADLAGGA